MTSSAGARPSASLLGDRYELVRPVTGDGTTDVYEAHDRVLQRPVAVRRFPPSDAMDRNRFEGEVARLLEDPDVQVYDAGEWSDEGGYVVLELGAGPTPAGVVVGDAAVSGDDPTTVVAVGGDTSVMPVVLRPEPEPAVDAAPAAAAAGAGRALWLALAAIALVVLIVATQGGGGIEAPPPTSEPVAVTSPPPTTAPPTTAAPAPEPPGNGKGKGRGKGGR